MSNIKLLFLFEKNIDQMLTDYAHSEQNVLQFYIFSWEWDHFIVKILPTGPLSSQTVKRKGCLVFVFFFFFNIYSL